MPRFGAEHGRRSIRESPLYIPYYMAIQHVAGPADSPAGTLRESTIIGRGKLFDAINDSPKCGRILKDIRKPLLTADENRNKDIDRERQGIMVVVGTIMGDLGYHRFSDHAWSRHPVEG